MQNIAIIMSPDQLESFINQIFEKAEDKLIPSTEKGDMGKQITGQGNEVKILIIIQSNTFIDSRVNQAAPNPKGKLSYLKRIAEFLPIIKFLHDIIF